jgi:leader peptidase (prepilin peptidase) / N-methyltransferase
MLALWMAISIEVRIFLVGLLSLCLGPIVNWTIYNAAYFPRPISPWGRIRFRTSQSSKQVDDLISSTSSWNSSHLPIIGWLSLRNESRIHGSFFWIRPLFLELLFPIFIGWLYWFETTGGLLPRLALPAGAGIQGWLHVQFVSHAILVFLMCIATFIDFDERTIPDWITVPGTLVGLLGSLCSQHWHLPIDLTHSIGKAWPAALSYDAPRSFLSYQGTIAWVIGIACFSIWCFALADRRWIMRRGIVKAWSYFWAGIFRNPSWKQLLLIWGVGMVVLSIALRQSSPLVHQSLLSSLIGMALGGFTVWIVRWIAGLAIGMEALGFGDVTLMAMVGAFVGWQPVVIAFFVSPMLAIIFVVIRYCITGDNQTPFGPYLCAGVLVTLLAWDRIWNQYFQDLLFVVGPFLFQILFGSLLLMGALLWIWRLVKQTVLLRI